MSDRHRFRADWDDYNNGIYFVTVCCADRRHFLGEISGTDMLLSPCGAELQRWIEILKNRPKAMIINHVIMPNHFHLLVQLEDNDPSGNNQLGCLRPPRHGDLTKDNHHNSHLARFIGQLKRGITMYARMNGIPFGWQERYYDNIINNPHVYRLVMDYIDNNVLSWADDRLNDTPPLRPVIP